MNFNETYARELERMSTEWRLTNLEQALDHLAERLDRIGLERESTPVVQPVSMDAADEIFTEVWKELKSARQRYPEWQSNLIEAAAVMVEEAGEALKSCNNYHHSQGDDTPADIRKEVIQTMAMCMRFLLETPAMQPLDLSKFKADAYGQIPFE